MVDMTPLLLVDIERAVRSSWGADTCPSETRAQWSPENPARWQCLVTTLVLNDLLGGELVRGEVRVNGERTDYHWWNRLGVGVDIDLTREQFGAGEIVTEGVIIPRPPTFVRPREEYELLRDRVAAKLGKQPAVDAASIPR
jgi:hypothetical protein